MFEVAGPLRVGADVGDMPTAGTIRWNDEKDDFEGYTGTAWVSLTNSSGLSGSGVVVDIDGNEYLTITIGSQTWMRQNLRTNRYRNGEPIPEVLLDNDWAGLSSGAWCWYDHDPEKEMPYGKLYNWFAVNDTNGLCPTGWHIPTDAEWTTLTDFLGGTAVAGGKMKTTGTIQAGTGYWEDPNTLSTNESGFTGLPAGFRGFSGFFDNTGTNAYWWSSTQWSTTRAYMRYLSSANGVVERTNSDKNLGFTVRCVSD